MVSKKVVNLANLEALGARRLAELLLELGIADAGIKISVVCPSRRSGMDDSCEPFGLPGPGQGLALSIAQGEHDAVGGQDVLPLADQLTVELPDWPDLALEVVQAQRVDVPGVLTEHAVPVDLVGQAVPGEADQRDAVLLEAHHVGPLLLQP